MESEVYYLIIYCVHVHTQLYGTKRNRDQSMMVVANHYLEYL